MENINSDLGPITNLDQSWKGHTHYEVEQFLKDQIETLNGQTVRSKISVAVSGNAIKSFLNNATDVKFGYTVTYTKDNVAQTACKVKITVGNKVAYNGDSVAGAATESLNIAGFLNSVSDSTVYVVVRAYDVDENGQETTYGTARITYNRQTATLSTSTALGTVDPSTLTFTTSFSTESATLVAEFYDATGASKLSTAKRTLTTSGMATISVPTLTKGAHVVKAYLKLNDTDETIGNVASTTIVSTSGAEEGDIFIVIGTVENAKVNDYVDIQFSTYVHHTSGSSDEVIPVAMQESSGTTYITKAIRNVANGARQTWHYLVKKDLVTLRIGVPKVENGNIKYSLNGQIQFEGEPVSFTFNATTSSITWVTPEDTSLYLTAQNKTNNDFDLGTWSDGNKSVGFDDVQFSSAGSGWSDITINQKISTALMLLRHSMVSILRLKLPASVSSI